MVMARHGEVKAPISPGLDGEAVDGHHVVNDDGNAGKNAGTVAFKKADARDSHARRPSIGGRPRICRLLAMKKPSAITAPAAASAASD